MLRHDLRAGRQRGTGNQDDELVPADAPQRVHVADGRAEAGGHGLKEFIADDVAEGVVDLLEVVEVDEEHGHGRLLLAGLGQEPLGPLEQQ